MNGDQLGEIIKKHNEAISDPNWLDNALREKKRRGKRDTDISREWAIVRQLAKEVEKNGGIHISPNTTLLQVRLRMKIFDFIKDNPSTDFKRIIDVLSPEYKRCQIQTAMNFLCKHEYIFHVGLSKYAKWSITENDVFRNIIPASEGKKLENVAIPDRPLSHAEYWLHILTHATSK